MIRLNGLLNDEFVSTLKNIQLFRISQFLFNGPVAYLQFVLLLLELVLQYGQSDIC